MHSTDHLTPFVLETMPQKSLPLQDLQPIAFGLFCFWCPPQKLSMTKLIPVDTNWYLYFEHFGHLQLFAKIL